MKVQKVGRQLLPMQHYSMGGIRTKPTGESQWLEGLFACGEAASLGYARI